MALTGATALVAATVGAPLVGSPSMAGAAGSCDVTVRWGAPVGFSGSSTPFTKTVCVTGIPAGHQPLLDIRAWPKNRSTDSINLELDKTDGTYLRSSRVVQTGATQRVALADLAERTYSFTVSSPVVEVAGLGVDSGVPFSGTISLGDVPTVGTALFGSGTTVMPVSGDGEPSIAVDRSNPKARNAVFITAPVGVPSLTNPISTGDGSGGVDFWRLLPGAGQSFKYQNISIGDGGGDSHVVLDGNGGVYVADLALTNVNLTKSTDEGSNFGQLPPSGNTTADREWLALGRGNFGAQTLFLSYHDFATEEFWECQGPSSGLAEQDCIPVVPQNNPGLLATAASNTIIGPQVALPGGGVAMPGAVSTTAENLANETSGPMDHLYALVSPDGNNFNAYPIVSLPNGYTVSNIFPVMAADPVGNLYAAWSQQNAGKSGAPAGPITLMMSWSTDGGVHWAHPVRVNPPEDGSAILPWIAAPSPGHVVIGYDASTTRDNPNDATANWYMKTALSSNVLPGQRPGTSTPGFAYSYVSPNPVRYGEVCMSGIFCSQQGDDGRALLDFTSVDYDSSGCAAYAFASSANEAVYKASGASMLAQTMYAHQTAGCLGPPSTAGMPVIRSVSSPEGSASAGAPGLHWVNLRAHIRHE